MIELYAIVGYICFYLFSRFIFSTIYSLVYKESVYSDSGIVAEVLAIPLAGEMLIVCFTIWAAVYLTVFHPHELVERAKGKIETRRMLKQNVDRNGALSIVEKK